MRSGGCRFSQRDNAGISDRGRRCQHAGHRCVVPFRRFRPLGNAVSGAQGRPPVPVWMMGLTNALFGMYGGILVISVPQLLSARHVPEATIAAMTAVMISPGFWTFLASPLLDVRFSRRWYSAVTAVVSAALLSLALLNLEHPAVVGGF